jgi:high-affinity iron transporter
MVGEQAQEMQLAHWLPVTTIPALENVIPGWMGMWFAVFPTVETLSAQAFAAVLVIGSYYGARLLRGSTPEPDVAIPDALESGGVAAE